LNLSRIQFIKRIKLECWHCDNGIVVGHFPCHSEVKGSSPATAPQLAL
jgi:hypothetical protein